jgi:hypothetical protein
MAVNGLLQRGDLAGLLRHGGLVAFGKFVHALGKGLADSVHLAVDGGMEGGEPFVVHDQRLDLSLGERGVFGVSLSVEVGLGILQGALEVSLLVAEL